MKSKEQPSMAAIGQALETLRAIGRQFRCFKDLEQRVEAVASAVAQIDSLETQRAKLAADVEGLRHRHETERTKYEAVERDWRTDHAARKQREEAAHSQRVTEHTAQLARLRDDIHVAEEELQQLQRVHEATVKRLQDEEAVARRSLDQARGDLASLRNKVAALT